MMDCFVRLRPPRNDDPLYRRPRSLAVANPAYALKHWNVLDLGFELATQLSTYNWWINNLTIVNTIVNPPYAFWVR